MHKFSLGYRLFKWLHFYSHCNKTVYTSHQQGEFSDVLADEENSQDIFL